MSLTAVTKPTHDHATLVTYAQLGIYGWFLYGFGPSVPLLRDERGLSSSVAALHGTLFAIGTITIGLLGPRLSIRLGRGGSLRLASAFLAVGLAVYSSGLPLAITLVGALLCGLGGGLILVFCSAHLSAHQGPAAAPASLAEANSLAAVCGLLAPLAVGIGVAIGWGWRPGLLVAAVASIILEFVRGPRRAFDDEPDEVKSTVKTRHRNPLPREYWWALATITCLVAVEFSLVFWSSDLLRTRGGLGEGASAASLTAVVAGMALGRGGGSVLARRVDPERLLIAAIAVALGGFAVVWISTSAAVILAGLFITGLGVGLHWPLGMARAARASDHQSDRAASGAAVAAGLASGLAPFILGALADQAGIHRGFLVVPVFLLSAMAIVMLRPISPDVPSAAPSAAG